VRYLLIALLLTGCASKPSTFYLTKPPRPVLPTWELAEMECLPKELRDRMVMRDAMRKWYAESLEAVIDSTRER